MEDRGDNQGKNPDACRVLLEHSVRCWENECDNAARLVDRIKLVSAMAAAILGLGLFKIEWFYDPSHTSRVRYDWVMWIIRGLLVFALMSLAWSFWRILRRQRRRSVATASWHMLIPRASHADNIHDSADATLIATERVHRATLSLMRRNARMDQRLRASLRWFFAGILCIFLVILLYVIFSVPPIIPDERGWTDGHRSTRNANEANAKGIEISEQTGAVSPTHGAGYGPYN